jgi:hypothetical protein
MWRFGVYGSRVNREAGVLAWKTFLGFRQAEIMPKQIQQVGGVPSVMNGEGAIKVNLVGIFAQKPGADRVKGPGPR